MFIHFEWRLFSYHCNDSFSNCLDSQLYNFDNQDETVVEADSVVVIKRCREMLTILPVVQQAHGFQNFLSFADAQVCVVLRPAPW